MKIFEKSGDYFENEGILSKEILWLFLPNNFIEKLYNGSINSMLVAFAKSKKLSKKDLEDLIKLVGDEEDK